MHTNLYWCSETHQLSVALTFSRHPELHMLSMSALCCTSVNLMTCSCSDSSCCLYQNSVTQLVILWNAISPANTLLWGYKRNWMDYLYWWHLKSRLPYMWPLRCLWQLHTHTHIHTYIHTYIHTHMYTHTYTCIHTYLHTYIHCKQVILMIWYAYIINELITCLSKKYHVHKFQIFLKKCVSHLWLSGNFIVQFLEFHSINLWMN